MFFSSRVSTPPNAVSSPPTLASPRSDQGRLSQDSEEPDWLKSAAEELAPSPPPPLTQRASEEEPEWLSKAATILQTPPSAVGALALAQATARAAAAERRAAEVEAENLRLRAEMRHRTPASAQSTPASTLRPRRPSGSSRAMDARIAAARDAGDEELLRSLLMEAARRCVDGAPSPSVGGGAPEASGAAPGPVSSPRGAPSPTPSSAGTTRRAHRFACPECGHPCTAVLPQKLTMVRCECGAMFGVQRPAGKKQAQRTHGASAPVHDSILERGCI
tara:strand:+ start:56 stop:883 length:828 start_codon:yes stop_codon:yes gene_type:complete